MSNGFEIAGSAVTLAGAIWLSIDAILARRNIKTEAGANRLQEILTKHGLGRVLLDKKGKHLDSEEALRLWLAQRTIVWNWIALGLMTVGFGLDLFGKLRS